MPTEKKRIPGQITVRDGKKIWLVLSESTKNKRELGWVHKCGAEIMAKTVYHPIWDGPFACSGGGEVRTETIPYCPKCEAEPNSAGDPIDVPYPGLARKI